MNTALLNNTAMLYVLKNVFGYLSAFRTDGGGCILTSDKDKAKTYALRKDAERVKNDYKYENFEVKELCEGQRQLHTKMPTAMSTR